MIQRHAPARGFTLTEMAVVLVIIALLVGGLLVPLSAQRNIDARRDTTRAMDTIREALLGYVIVNGRLPCPADRNIASGNANAGLESYNGGKCQCAGSSSIAGSGTACADSGIVTGVLPWATLGLPETDGWTNRYTYQVTAAYARSLGSTPLFCDVGSANPAVNSAFALCTSGKSKVFNSSASYTVPLTTDNEVPAIVVSHGDNGLGAWQTGGNQKAGAGGDELANADDDFRFVSNTSIDDLVVWISRPVLMNRMIAAGKLP